MARPPRSSTGRGAPPLRTLQQTREFLRRNGGRAVSVEVHAADGIGSAYLMWKELSARRRGEAWEVKNLRHLGAAAALSDKVCSAGSAIGRLLSKLSRPLVIAVQGGARSTEGGAPSIGRVISGARSIDGVVTGGQGGARSTEGGVVTGGQEGALSIDGIVTGARSRRRRGGRGAHARGGGHGALGFGHDAQGRVAFADRSGVASIKNLVDDMRQAEKEIWGTSSPPLRLRARDVADEMNKARLELRKFSEGFAKLEAMSGRRWNRNSQKLFDDLEAQRRDCLKLLRPLQGHLAGFASANICFV